MHKSGTAWPWETRVKLVASYEEWTREAYRSGRGSFRCTSATTTEAGSTAPCRARPLGSVLNNASLRLVRLSHVLKHHIR